MTNGELCGYLEKIAELTCIMLRQCETDQTKIDRNLWHELVILYEKVEEYI